eukprot:scaffold74822_cov57-Phaeocystis_antarctica.AAC.1
MRSGPSISAPAALSAESGAPGFNLRATSKSSKASSPTPTRKAARILACHGARAPPPYASPASTRSAPPASPASPPACASPAELAAAPPLSPPPPAVRGALAGVAQMEGGAGGGAGLRAAAAASPGAVVVEAVAVAAACTPLPPPPPPAPSSFCRCRGAAAASPAAPRFAAVRCAPGVGLASASPFTASRFTLRVRLGLSSLTCGGMPQGGA